MRRPQETTAGHQSVTSAPALAAGNARNEPGGGGQWSHIANTSVGMSGPLRPSFARCAPALQEVLQLRHTRAVVAHYPSVVPANTLRGELAKHVRYGAWPRYTEEVRESMSAPPRCDCAGITPWHEIVPPLPCLRRSRHCGCQATSTFSCPRALFEGGDGNGASHVLSGSPLISPLEASHASPSQVEALGQEQGIRWHCRSAPGLPGWSRSVSIVLCGTKVRALGKGSGQAVTSRLTASSRSRQPQASSQRLRSRSWVTSS